MQPQEAAQQAYTGEYALIYEDLVSNLRIKRAQYNDITDIVIEHGLNNQSRVLEIGPSRAPTLVKAIQVRIPEFSPSFYGIDYYTDMINKERDFPIKMLQADIGEGIPLAESSMDVVVINSVLLSLNKDTLLGVFEELERVIKPEGLLVLSELDRNVGKEISRAALRGEIRLLEQEYEGNFMGRIKFLTKLFEEMVHKWKLKRISDNENKAITQSHEGFTREELEELGELTNFTLQSYSRTYADSYHLISFTNSQQQPL